MPPVSAQPEQTGGSSDTFLSPFFIAVFQNGPIRGSFSPLKIRLVVSYKMKVVPSLPTSDDDRFFRKLFLDFFFPFLAI